MFTGLNVWAILVSGLTYWIIGGVWYAAIFAKQYQAALNFDDEQKKQSEKDFPKALASHFVSGIISSLFLAILIKFMNTSSLTGGMVIGFLGWLAFAFTINLNYLMFEKRPTNLFLLNTGFFLIAFMAIGGILAVWQ